MEFSAKVQLLEKNNAENLVRAFFDEFNPESCILIKNKEAIVKIVFETPPSAIIDALCNCKVVACNYGAINEEELFNIPFVKESKRKTPSDVEDYMEDNNLKKKLDEIAKKAVSYEKFIDVVGLLLETSNKMHTCFANIVHAACNVEKITWKSIKQYCDDNGLKYSDFFKLHGTERVCEKMKVSDVSIMKFIKALVAYKTFPFAQNKVDVVSESHVETDSELHRDDKLNYNEEGLHKEDIHNEEICEDIGSVDNGVESYDESSESNEHKEIREIAYISSIPAFINLFESINKSQSIEERVVQVLNAMGLEEKSEEEQQMIFAITDTAVRQKKISYDIIFIRANINMEDTMMAREFLYKFINEFAEKNGVKNKVKTLDFFRELQRIIMFNDELEKYMDFVD